MYHSFLPWAVLEEHRDTHIYRMLERESLLRAGLPCGTQEEFEQLAEWKSGLTVIGAVVDYNPRIAHGLILVHATGAEEGELIRRPQS